MVNFTVTDRERVRWLIRQHYQLAYLPSRWEVDQEVRALLRKVAEGSLDDVIAGPLWARLSPFIEDIDGSQ